MKTILSRAISLHRASDDNSGCWFHTVPPMGEYDGGNLTHNGEPVPDAVIVIDRRAYDNIISSFNFNGILVDREHFSLDLDKPSDAMAWAVDIREDPDGLWTKWSFTPPGRDAWDNRILISRSPVLELEHLGDCRFRPVALRSIAMTNTPHFDLSNIAARAAENQTTKGKTKMNRLLELLGLPADASEEDVAAAVQSLIDRSSASEQAQTAAEEERDEAAQALSTAEEERDKALAECRNARADAFIAKHRDRIADVAAFRKAYLAAPDATEAAVGAFSLAPSVKMPTRISARGASTPSDSAVSLAAYRAMPSGPEKDDYLAKHKNTLLRLECEEQL